MKKLAICLLCVLVALLPGCHLLTQQQKSAAAETVYSEYRAGRITRAQCDAAIEALEKEGAVNWDALLQSGTNVLMSLLLGTPIISAVATRRVMKIRGPVATPEERVARAKTTTNTR